MISNIVILPYPRCHHVVFVYVQECSQSLKMPERVLIAEINKIRKRDWTREKYKNREENRVSVGKSVSRLKHIRT